MLSRSEIHRKVTRSRLPRQLKRHRQPNDTHIAVQGRVLDVRKRDGDLEVRHLLEQGRYHAS